MIKIYHNPRCSKSRETLALIKDHGEECEIIEYLKDTPTEKELKDLLAKLGLKADDIIRKSEDVYKENYKGKNLTEAQLIKAMVEHPVLIERPIVVSGNKAVLGRPPQNVLTLFTK